MDGMLVNFGWVRPGVLAAMGRPSPDDWPLLVRKGIRAVLSLTESPPGGDPETEGLEACHVPVEDFTAPSDKDLQRCVAWIDTQVRSARPVVVHCGAGLGRTGTVVAAFLVTQGFSPEQAVGEVRRLRPGSLETVEQVDAVRRFAAHVRGAPER
jgi:atypical dual specificity phosphatase